MKSSSACLQTSSCCTILSRLSAVHGNQKCPDLKFLYDRCGTMVSLPDLRSWRISCFVNSLAVNVHTWIPGCLCCRYQESATCPTSAQFLAYSSSSGAVLVASPPLSSQPPLVALSPLAQLVVLSPQQPVLREAPFVHTIILSSFQCGHLQTAHQPLIKAWIAPF